MPTTDERANPLTEPPSGDPDAVSAGVPERIGPYRIIAPLGKGGMGVVYSAQHRETGQAAAVKTVRVPRANLLAGLRREIAALAALDHPGIVTIFDEGLQDGLPWYAMELLAGEPLSLFASRWLGTAPWAPSTAATAPDTLATPSMWWTTSLANCGENAPARVLSSPRPLPIDEMRHAAGSPQGLRDCLTLVRRICSALAYLHGEGLVHRDLKPANIVIVDGRPVLVDFGLSLHRSSRIHREALLVENTILGTAAYMAPEQARGDEIDARADLYALGCILFELVSGRRPFFGTSTAEIAQKHIAEPPLAPSTFVRGVPAKLDELVLELLAKKPRRRIGHASDVAAALDDLGADPVAAGPSPPPRDYLYRPRLAGRQHVLERLTRNLDELHTGRGSATIVLGESGMGKTRLAVALGRLARQRRVRVLTGECRGGRGDEQWAALAGLKKPLEALAEWCRNNPELTSTVFGQRAPVLAPYAPAIRWLDGFASLSSPLELPPGEARLRLTSYLGETLAAAAAVSPILVVVDDLQWADPLTLAFVEFHQRVDWFARHPVMLLGLCRAESSAVVDQIGGAIAARVIEIRSLDRAEVAAMAADMLAVDKVSHEFAEFVAKHCEGNPFFVAEYLQAAIDAGHLRRDERGSWTLAERGDDEPADRVLSRLELPRSLRELIDRRLSGLDPEALQIATAAAVLGREADVAEVTDMLRRRGIVLRHLDELARRRILEDQGETVYVCHDKLREELLARLTSEERRAWHATAAQTLEDTRAAPGRRAHHLREAGQHERARQAFLAAADAALVHFAHDEAEAYLRAAIALADEPDVVSTQARLRLAKEILGAQTRVEEALAEHETALAHARCLDEPALVADCLRASALMFHKVSRLDEADRAAQEALTLAHDLGDAAMIGEIQMYLMAIAWSRGDLAVARDHCDEALESFRHCHDLGGQGEVLASLGTILYSRGETEEALSTYRRALTKLEAAGRIRRAAVTRANIAVALRELGRIDEARGLLDIALITFREIGDKRREGWVLSLIGTFRADQRLDEMALESFERGLAILSATHSRRAEALCLGQMALVEARLGRHTAAATNIARALELMHEAGDRINLAHMWRSAARVRRLSGDVGGAQSALDALDALVAERGNPLAEGLAHCERAWIAKETGEDPEHWLTRAEAIAASMTHRRELNDALAELGRQPIVD